MWVVTLKCGTRLMGKQLRLSAWLPTIVIVVLTGNGGKKQNGLELAFGVSRLKAVINSYLKGDEFTLKGDYVLAIGKGKMDKCVLVLKCLQIE
jgi:hypothetical protein